MVNPFDISLLLYPLHRMKMGKGLDKLKVLSVFKSI